MDDVVSLESDINIYGDMVYRTAYIYVKNFHTAEDIFQEVFIKLFINSVPFSDINHKKAWLIRTTINCSINYLKSSWYRKKSDMDIDEILVVSPENVEEDTIRKENSREILGELFKLKKQYREVIFFFYYSQMSIREISSILDIPENTVKSRLHRGKNKLKNQIDGGCLRYEEIY